MTLTLRACCVMVVAGGLLAAPALAGQQAGKAKQEGAARPVAASAAVPLVVDLPVTGMTEDDTDRIQSALGSLEHEMWICKACRHMQEEKGSCDSCQKDLVAETMPVLNEVTADVQHNTLSFSVNEGMRIQLSEVQRALGAGQVKVDPAKLLLESHTLLYVQGPPSEEAAKKLEQSLKTSKLFEKMELRHEADSRDYHVEVFAVAKAPSHAEVAKTIERVGDGFKLTDVAWLAPKRVS